MKSWLAHKSCKYQVQCPVLSGVHQISVSGPVYFYFTLMTYQTALTLKFKFFADDTIIHKTKKYILYRIAIPYNESYTK